MFNVMQSQDDFSVCGSVVKQEAGRMNAFDQNWVIVELQSRQQSFIHPRCDDIRKLERYACDAFSSRVIKYFLAVVVKLGLLAIVFGEAMQINFDTCFMKCHEFMVDVENATVVNGKRNDKRNDMKMLVRHDQRYSYKRRGASPPRYSNYKWRRR